MLQVSVIPCLITGTSEHSAINYLDYTPVNITEVYYILRGLYFIVLLFIYIFMGIDLFSKETITYIDDY